MSGSRIIAGITLSIPAVAFIASIVAYPEILGYLFALIVFIIAPVTWVMMEFAKDKDEQN
ncbi:MAG: hypothetical protein KAH32_07965 [Chlamydiia bacterium]|nr:hypothetical protein [Chlamydiia bacterium]